MWLCSGPKKHLVMVRKRPCFGFNSPVCEAPSFQERSYFSIKKQGLFVILTSPTSPKCVEPKSQWKHTHGLLEKQQCLEPESWWKHTNRSLQNTHDGSLKIQKLKLFVDPNSSLQFGKCADVTFWWYAEIYNTNLFLCALGCLNCFNFGRKLFVIVGSHNS